MNLTRRREEMLRLLLAEGEVEIAPLAQMFDVSEMTIRRDLEALEAEGHARRVRRGAITTVSRSYEPPFALRTTMATDAKRAIGRAAADLVDDGDSIIIDVGSTTLELARNVHGRRGLTVLTTSLPIAFELGRSAEIRVIMTGGEVRPEEFSLTGSQAEAGFEGLNCDVAFLGVAGLHAERGVTEYNIEDARVKQAAAKAARRCVVLADATKLGKVTFAGVAPITAVDVLITDAPPDHPVVEATREAGIEVLSLSAEKEPADEAAKAAG